MTLEEAIHKFASSVYEITRSAVTQISFEPEAYRDLMAELELKRVYRDANYRDANPIGMEIVAMRTGNGDVRINYIPGSKPIVSSEPDSEFLQRLKDA